MNYSEDLQNAVKKLRRKWQHFIYTKSKDTPFQSILRRHKIPEILRNMDIFLKTLSDSPIFSSDKILSIEKEISEVVSDVKAIKDKIIKSTEDGSSLTAEDFSKLSHLSKRKQKLLHTYCIRRDIPKVLSILNIPHPYEQFQELLKKDFMEKADYEYLYSVLLSLGESKQKLAEYFFSLPSISAFENKLEVLYDRIQWLKEILFEKNDQLLKLWTDSKEERPGTHFRQKIVQLYLYDNKTRSSVDMLLLDCMTLKKSSEFYSGIHLRDVIAHGNVLLESLCNIFRTHDLFLEKMEKAILMIHHEESIAAILEFYQLNGKNYKSLNAVLKKPEVDEHVELIERIKKCQNFQEYVGLLQW